MSEPNDSADASLASPPAPQLWSRTIRRTLRACDPRALIVSPLFLRDMRVTGRTRTQFLLRLLVGIGLIGVVLMAYAGQMGEHHLGRASRLQQLQTIAPMITFVTLWFVFVVLSLAAPVLTAPVLLEEIRQRSATALLSSPVSGAQIVFGALASRTVQIFTLAAMALPVLLGVRVLGGVPAALVLQCAAIIASSALLGCTLGLVSGLLQKQITKAVGGAVSLSVTVMFLPPILSILYSLARTGAPAPSPWLFSISSPFALGFVSAGLQGDRGPATLLAGTGEVWMVCTLFNLALAFVLAGACSVLVRPILTRRASAVVKPKKRGRRTKKAKATTTQDAGERFADSSRTVGDRPVLWRELRRSWLGSRFKLVLLTLALAAVFIWSIVVVGHHEGAGRYPSDPSAFIAYCWACAGDGLRADGMVLMILTTVGTIVVVIQAATLTSTGISAERESRTWDDLLTTRLSTREILLSKAAGNLRIQWYFPACLLLVHIIGVLAGAQHPIYLLHLTLGLVGPILFLSCTGVLMSMLVKRSRNASALNLTLAIGLWAGLPALAGATYALLLEPLGADELGEFLFVVVLSINPAMHVLYTLTVTTEAASSGYHEYELPNGFDLAPAGFMLYQSAMFALALVVSGLVVAITLRLFRRFGGRVS